MDYKQFLAAKKARDLKIRALRAQGRKVEWLAAKFKVSKQRISQVCKAL